MNKQKVGRQKVALAYLTKQLESGTKKTKDGDVVPLTKKDIKRIKQEINILESRIPGLKKQTNAST